MKWLRAVPGKMLDLGLRVIVGGVFVFAGTLKILDPAKFALDVENYRMLPHQFVNLFAITLPWVEFVAGILLVLGVWVRANALIMTLMTSMFLIAITQAVARGLDIQCGCFGTVDARKVGLTTLAVDAGLLFMAAWLCWRLRSAKTGGPSRQDGIAAAEVKQPQAEQA